jgi:hypothetical protein
VKINLMKGSGIVRNISVTTANDGIYTSWQIPGSLATGTDYRIQIASFSNPAITDTSDAVFTITP